MITTEFWQALVETLEDGPSVFLVMVVASEPGSPGTAGAAMLVRPDGSQVGTVGGGIMEYNLLSLASEALAADDFTSRLEVLWHRKDAPGIPSGMICSGSQTNLYCRCDPSKHVGLFRRVLEISRELQPGTLIFSADGITLDGTDDADPLTVDPAAWAVRLRVAAHRRVAIIGGGHCGCALSHAMRRLRYVVTVMDTRPDATLFVENTDAHRRVVLDDYQAAGEAIDAPAETSVVVMTTDYPSDVRALAGTLPLPFPFVGVMGSQAKLNHIRADLRRQGFSDGDLSRLRAPIGIPIGSHTPEEIAISIAAQLIQESSRIRESSATDV